MYQHQHQLRDDAFGTLGGGHCGEQPRLAAGGAPSSSSPPAALAPPLAQAHGGGQQRQLFEALVGGGSLLRGPGGGKGSVAVGDLGVLVRWMRELAADPVAPLPVPSEHRARKRHVLALRRARYLRLEDVADAEELPSFSKVSSLCRKTLVFCRIVICLKLFGNVVFGGRLLAFGWLWDCI
jgi:hypothetical protein